MSELTQRVARMMCCERPAGECCKIRPPECLAHVHLDTATAIISAVREDCAKIADEMDNCQSSSYDNGSTDNGYEQAKRHIAAAIRSGK